MTTPSESRPTIGLLTHGAGDPNSRAVWAGVARACQSSDANLICFPGKPIRSPHAFEAQSNVLYDLVDSSRIDGLIVWLSGLTHRADLTEVRNFLLRYYQMPMVTVGVFVEGFPGVVVDNEAGMGEVVAHLIEAHGLRRIAFIRGPEQHEEAEARYRAYQSTLAAHGLSFDPALVVVGDFRETGGELAVEELLDRRHARFDAVAAASDNMAIGAMMTLQTRGLRVPADVAVVGVNDEQESCFVTPPLTTGPLRFFDQGQRAAEMLLGFLAGEGKLKREVLPTRLLVRQSCGCPDPLVATAAISAPAPAIPAAEPRSGQQDDWLRAMTQAVDIGGTPAERRSIELLLDALAADLPGRTRDHFLGALAELLHPEAIAGEPVSRWQAVVSDLRRFLRQAHLPPAEHSHAEELFQQARVLISETAQRAQAGRYFQAQQQTRAVSEIDQALSTAIDLPELVETLATALPQLGVQRCYLSLYEDPSAPDVSSRLILAYDERGRIPLEGGGRHFPSPQLAPAGILPIVRRFSLVAEALHLRADQLGFVLFEAEPRAEEFYEILRGLISSALKRIQLTAHNIELYHEAVEAQQVAEEANNLKSRFLATVSHELRTPLSLIVGTAEMMLRDEVEAAAPLPAAFRRDLHTIRSSAQHLSSLIGDVLDLARGHAGELRLANEPLPVSELLDRVAVLAEPLARGRGLAWRYEPLLTPVLVWGDRTRLQQVALNLISNAIKFTERGSVGLSAAIRQAEVVIEVSDTGIGISEEDRDAIFDEFRQSERTLERGFGGMGLGLAISRRLVELHGGRIGVRAHGNAAAGATVYFALPILAEAAPSFASPAARMGVVLLLTDRTDGGARLGLHLRERGYVVEKWVLPDRPDWLAQVMTQPPGAIVLDYEPAAERGWELMQMLKQNPATKHVPVVFYKLDDESGGGSLLTLDYLAKPVGGAELAGAFERQGLRNDAASRGKTVLIVDDDPGILELHERIVAAYLPDARLLSAANGRIALEMMAHDRPDLVLLDLMMPEVDGFTVLQRMRDLPETRQVPVIVLTAQSLNRDDMARLQKGVAAVLSKGLFTPVEVLAQVEQALARSKHLGSDAQRTVRQIMVYIHEHYADPITRSDLARHFSLNERYLTRVFHQETGLAPMTYLNRYRIRQARALLEHSELKITDVATACGFSDSSYFARVFQHEVGMSPGAFRRRLHTDADVGRVV